MEGLLTGVEPSAIKTFPFTHIAASHALPTASYAELACSFPSLKIICNGKVPDLENTVVRMSNTAALASPDIAPAWRSFFEFHTSTPFWLDIVRVFGSAIRSRFPKLETRIGRKLEDFRVGPRGEKGDCDIRLECQFAVNTPTTHPSSIKTPHVDKRQTLIAGLFYMREPDDPAPGGDLELYSWDHHPRFLPYRMILPSDVKQVASIPYTANSFMCFLNSPESVHGVSPRGPADRLRRYINLIAEVDHHLFRTPLISVPGAIMNWGAIREIRRGNHAVKRRSMADTM